MATSKRPARGPVDYARFAERFAARTDRWGLMDEFQKEWKLPRRGAKPVSLAAIRRAEKRLGFALPEAFVEWLRLPGNPYLIRPKLFWTHLLWPKELVVWPRAKSKDGLVVFMAEYQHCCEWAFRAADARLPDPPVYYGSTQEDDDPMPPAAWKRQSDTFSGFMLHLLMVRSVDFATRFHACKTDATTADWKRVGKGFAEVGFPPWLEYGDACRLLGGADCLLLARSNPPWGSEKALTLSARTAAARDAATELTGLKWGHVQDID